MFGQEIMADNRNKSPNHHKFPWNHHLIHHEITKSDEITMKSHEITMESSEITLKSHEITMKSHEITIKSHEITI